MIPDLIIYMKKFLDCDWLRGMQFLGNTVQKKGNLVQNRVKNVTFWLADKQRNSLRANQMRHLNGAKFGSTPDQGARFSKVPLTFRARNQIFKSKYKE